MSAGGKPDDARKSAADLPAVIHLPDLTTPTAKSRQPGRRARVADPRIAWVHVRCSIAERANIAAKAQKAGLSAGAFLRKLGIGTPGPRARRSPLADRAALAETLGALGRLGSNVNQLARAANTTGELPDREDLAGIVQDVQRMRRLLMKALGHGD